MKTKLGISVGVMAAAAYFIAFFGGYTALLLLAGYILLFEQDSFLRKSIVKAFALAICFSIIKSLVGFIPNLTGLVNDVFSIFGGYFHIAFISSAVNCIDDVISIVEKLLFLLLGLMAFRQNTINMGPIDKLVD